MLIGGKTWNVNLANDMFLLFAIFINEDFSSLWSLWAIHRRNVTSNEPNTQPLLYWFHLHFYSLLLIIAHDNQPLMCNALILEVSHLGCTFTTQTLMCNVLIAEVSHLGCTFTTQPLMWNALILEASHLGCTFTTQPLMCNALILEASHLGCTFTTQQNVDVKWKK